MNDESVFNLHIRESFEDEKGERFIGPGVVELLEHMKTESSLSKSAAIMDMSYTKAIKIIKHLEEVLGVSILNRAHGGHERVGSSLTPFAITLIDEWNKFDKSLNEMAKPLSESFINALKEEAKRSEENE